MHYKINNYRINNYSQKTATALCDSIPFGNLDANTFTDFSIGLLRCNISLLRSLSLCQHQISKLSSPFQSVAALFTRRLRSTAVLDRLGITGRSALSWRTISRRVGG